MPVSELRTGERLLVLGGGTARVESIVLRGKVEEVCNFEVEGDHCYRVGALGVLVHNASTKCQTGGVPDPGLPESDGPYSSLYRTDNIPINIPPGSNFETLQIMKILDLNRSRHSDGRVHSDDAENEILRVACKSYLLRKSQQDQSFSTI